MTLLEVRIKYGFSQGEVGKWLGVAPQVVSSWERGIHKPSRKSWGRLKKVFPREFRELRDHYEPSQTPRGRQDGGPEKKNDGLPGVWKPDKEPGYA